MRAYRYFLLEHDRRTFGNVIHTFDDAKAALDELKLREFSKPSHMEVILLMSDSVETLMRTHSSYWPLDTERMLAQLDEAFAGSAAALDQSRTPGLPATPDAP